MRLLIILLLTSGVLFQQNLTAQVTVPCDVQITYTDGSLPPVPPDYNMSNGTINTCSGMFYDPGGQGIMQRVQH